MSIGAPAAGFIQRHRHELFAIPQWCSRQWTSVAFGIPILTDNDSVVAVRIDYLAAMENILRVLPDTKNVTVVVGASPIEKFWKDEIAKEVKPLKTGLRFHGRCFVVRRAYSNTPPRFRRSLRFSGS